MGRVATQSGWVSEHLAKRIARDLDNEVLPLAVFDELSDAGLLDVRLVTRWKNTSETKTVRYFPLWQVVRLGGILSRLRKLYIRGLIGETVARNLLFKVKFNAIKEE